MKIETKSLNFRCAFLFPNVCLQHPFMSSNVPPSSLSAREQLFSSSSLPRHHRNSSNQNVINVPISAPWYSRDPIVNPEPPSVGSRRPSKQSTNPYRVSIYLSYILSPSVISSFVGKKVDCVGRYRSGMRSCSYLRFHRMF